MSQIEKSLHFLAIILGIMTLSAPIIFMLRQSHRSKGRSSGTAAGSRTWVGVFLMTMGFTGLGIILWRPLPINLNPVADFFLALIGAILYFPGCGLYLWGLLTLNNQFGVSGILGAELYSDHKLITRGPFAIIRHPMYLGVLLTALGALFIFRTWAIILFLPMSLVVLNRANREEKLLEAEFGDVWKNYASAVPKWIPKR